jgi:hypothetical protein
MYYLEKYPVVWNNNATLVEYDYEFACLYAIDIYYCYAAKIRRY